MWHEKHVKAGVGAAAGLPPYAIGNMTELNHVLHDLDGPGFGTCPQPVSGQGTGPVNGCSQVYREPFESGGKIKIRTRRFGDNRWADENQKRWLGIFEKLDKAMIKAIENSAEGFCPSL